jgi:hypothetical protein
LIGVAGDRSERASPISAVIIRLDRMIQYSREMHFIDGGDYWILRWSLSSGSPEARPGGGV